MTGVYHGARARKRSAVAARRLLAALILFAAGCALTRNTNPYEPPQAEPGLAFDFGTAPFDPVADMSEPVGRPRPDLLNGGRAPGTCNNTCECADQEICESGVCTATPTSNNPVYCCAGFCPSGSLCQSLNGEIGRCE